MCPPLFFIIISYLFWQIFFLPLYLRFWKIKFHVGICTGQIQDAISYIRFHPALSSSLYPFNDNMEREKGPKNWKSHPLFMGIVDDKKWCPFFIWASEDPFFAPKNGNFQWFWVQKNGSSDAPIRKRTESELADETLVSYEYHYRVSFGKFLKIAYFRFIFGRFSLIKSQNQNPMLQSVNF